VPLAARSGARRDACTQLSMREGAAGMDYHPLMAVRWTMDHSSRRVEVTLEGETSPDDAARFFDALEAAKAISYGKLIDATLAVVKIDNRVMAIVGQRISGYVNPGPIAVVLPARGLEGHAKLFAMAVDAESRTRMFRTSIEAREWLDSIKLPKTA
jgi:hypothetical protein